MNLLNLSYRIFAAALLLCISNGLWAQTGNKFIRKGNDLYKKQQFTDAEANYKKALEKNSQSVVGHYNLGNSLYGQKRFDDARNQYSGSLKLSK